MYANWTINQYNLTYQSIQELEIELVSNGFHIIVVTTDNQVYTIGYGAQGQLGIGYEISVVSTLQNITAAFGFADDETVIQIMAVGENSILLTSNGRLFIWGSSSYGQIGNGLFVNQRTHSM
ncbi:MAG: hypothetical protein MZU97_25875 [Bacillus subtilis]|nr:hypothetical protein [Bacillus subtilis]